MINDKKSQTIETLEEYHRYISGQAKAKTNTPKQAATSDQWSKLGRDAARTAVLHAESEIKRKPR